MFTWLWIFEIVMLSSVAREGRALPEDPEPPPPNITTCEEFERGARFNPYLLIESMWKIFYFWAEHTELYPIIFALPAQNRLHKFVDEVETIEGLKLDWNKATLFMNPRPGTEVLFLYQNTPGAFRAVIKQDHRDNKVRPVPPPLIKLADVRMKLVDKYLGMMCCEDFTAYALARVTQMPENESMCSLAASRIGFKGPNGRSYLYFKRKFADEL